MLEHEQKAWHAGFIRVAGMDEAGRGPLAGPVVAGAVYIAQEFLSAEQDGVLAGLTDSKKLTVFQRNVFLSLFRDREEILFASGSASVNEIDRINILKATHLAMRRAVEALPMQPDHLLVDGLPVNGLPVSSTALVKGDASSLLIAAASVVAKVERDRVMEKLARAFPDYGWGRNKGYGTPEHLAALREHGPCKHHRHSFAPVRQLSFDF